MTHKFLALTLGLILFSAAHAGSAALAATYDLKEMTPSVKSALEGRKGRFDRLKELKGKGAIGENNQGYVTVLDHIEDAKEIVEAENADRKTIYKTIAEQNGLSGAIDVIERVFAQVQRDKAASGEKIQSEDGKWDAK